MDMDYDRKFEEMKGYIPFLENMIKRLESTGAIENPRQAQLDKIRSLRDLLLDKKKRMKMENLLKCEQVLVNLYAKVEQRDSLPGIKKDSVNLDNENPESAAANSKSDLEIVRNKLKTVVGVVCDNPETLPEIARANESEITCSLSGKEPALFQRRPNKASISPPKDSPNKRLEKSSPHSSNSRRGYTRVLLSPEPDKNRWSSTECPSDKVLYSRRSPHRSPRKRSPLHHKKDKKKSSKQESSSCKAKDLNITLKVPEESLKSLNTKDILSRIINCSDSDVDIDTLRELRKQILGELKQTGTNDDISDLILKSYKNTKKKTGKAKEVEEGELSDSESEAIDSIYGSLIVVEKDRKTLKSSEVRPNSEGENQSCKIQISLVINATADKNVDPDRIKIHDKVTDETEFEMYNKEDNKSVKLTPNENETSCKVFLDEPQTKSNDRVVIIDDEENVSTLDKNTNDTYASNTSVSEKETNVIEKNTKIHEKDKNVMEKKTSDKKDPRLVENATSEIPETKNLNISSESNSDRKTGSSKIGNENKINIASSPNVEIPFKPNFYKPLEHDLESKEGFNNSSDESVPKGNFENSSCQGMFSKKEEESIEIPLLNLESDPPIKPAKEDVMSEIDILQALKNEILSDTISIPGTDIATPALHQPKLIKVANAQEIKPKKRISIESYKEKAISKPLFVKEPIIDDLSKKQSLKLTEKECERFNFPTKLPLLSSDEDEEEIDKSSVTLEDIYENIAPKSPDDETSTDIEKTIPVIIPIDPIKNLPTGSVKADVDMRTMVPNMSSEVINHIPSLSAVNNNPDNIDVMKKENKTCEKGPLTDPRLKRDANPSVVASLNIHSTNPDRTPVLPSPYRNIIPNMTPSMTPNAKSYEMTPSYQSFETSENSNRRHVYAPTLLNQEVRDQRETSVNRESSRWSKSDKVVEENKRFDPLNNDGNQTKWDNLSRRGSVQRDDVDPKSNYSDLSPNYELYPYRNRHEPYENNYSFNRSDQFGRCDIAQTPARTFGRSECPSTPIHPFGRSDCPTTPIHPFGRSDCPSTPSHSFGRSDCPTTPLHPFGRLEVPTAMKSQFGRSECPATPVHHFGRSETPLTPVHSFGKSDYSQSQLSSNSRFGKDPRLNRSQDYDSSNRNRYDSGRNNSFERDRNISKYKWDARGNSYKSDFNQRSHDNSEPYRNFSREQSVGRNKFYPNNLNREITNSEYRDGVKSRFDLRRDRNTSKSTEDVGIKRSHHRERIGGPTTSSDEFSRFSKSLNDFKSTRDNTSDNRLSVKAHAGRSFTIDTSINRSFQEIVTKENSLLSNDMYRRRQRAASVGRTIIRESSVDKNSSSDIQRNRNANFRRAQSVGRDVAKHKSEKSLKDMKAQFESFKAKLEERKPLNYNDSKRNDYPLKVRESKYVDPHTRKERQQESYYYRQGTYLPKKNIRDPRLRRELYDNSNKNKDSREKTSYGIVYSNDNIAKGTVLRAGTGVKNYKIPKIKRPVEETDKTTTEVIVKDKNAEEKESTTVNVKNVPTTTMKEPVKEPVEKADSKISNEVCDSKIVSDGDGDENIQKRVTRSSKKSGVKLYGEECKIKPKKNRKSIIQDSDSDTMDSIKSEDKKMSSPKKQKSDENLYKSDTKIQDHVCEKVLSKDTNQKNNVIDILPKDTNKQNISTDSTANKEHILRNMSPTSTPEKKNKTKQDDGLNSSFSLDDLELFPDNIGSDSVIDNINSLIADLDNDLDSEKPIENIDHVTGEISMENMTVNIMDDKSNSSQTNENETLNVINEFIKNDLSKEEKIVPQNLNLNKAISESFTSISNLNLKNPVTELNNTDTGNNDVKDTLTKKSEKGSNKVVDRLNDGDISTSMEENCAENCTNAVVSTTADKQKAESTDMCEKNDVVNLEKRTDNSSTPDSTINMDETQIDTYFNDKKLPRSIENNHTEINSDVTSTHDSIEKESITINETDSQQKENFPQSNPFGSLLSMLQKSKIRELLHMLDDKSSDTEKIKRKLEKLSEIVSDDEDTDSVETGKHETKNDNKNAVQNGNDLTTINLTCKTNTFPEETNDKKEQPQPNELTNKVDEANDNTKEFDNLVNESKYDDVSSGMVLPGKDQTTTNLSYETIKTSEGTNYRKEQPTTTANELTKTINTTNDNTKDLHDSIVTMKSNNVNNTGNGDNKDTTGNEDNVADDEANKILKDVPNEKKSSSVVPTKKKITKKTTKKTRKKGVKNRVVKKKSVTRSEVSGTITDKPKPIKKRSRELMRLQDDIREMFISDDVLNVTGIRMCRLAKLADDNGQTQKDSQDSDSILITDKVAGEEQSFAEKTVKKRPGSKAKVKSSDKVDFDNIEKAKSLPKYKPGPKSKTKIAFENPDPYAFETDSNVGTHSINEFEKSLNNSSDSESDSSSTKSRESSERVIEIKKKKKKRSSWKAGVIKPKNRKKKDIKQTEATLDTAKVALVSEQVTIPDLNCFTDKLYCFNKNVVDYPCRLCSYSGVDIVHHYKKQHPHTEIPLSRMNPEIAKEAIEQCEDINFKEISKIPTEKYVCRFCFKEFSRKKATLEAFFWHIVSAHTGEYKHLCSECVNDRKCPFNLDIPPPPKDVKGQLIGYICGKCNFTQISVENLKTHVIDRHNDEETEVFTINLAVMTKKTFSSLLKRCNSSERPRVLRSSRSNQSLASDDLSDVTESDRNSDIDSVRRSSLSLVSSVSKNERVNIKSKLTFENDDTISDNSISYLSKSMDVTNEIMKSEQEDNEDDNDESASHTDEVFDEPPEKNKDTELDSSIESENATLGDVVTLPHFKIQYTETGAREYVCCINGNDRHYKTAMTISMKKHVQLNHKENWDGFCFICKLIVTTQGNHNFKDCFQHFIEKHMEEFPILENLVAETTFENEAPTTSNRELAGAKSLTKNFIYVRPIYELLPQPDETQSTSEDSTTSMPKIQSVVSLGSPAIDQPLPSPTYPKPCERREAPKAYKYEEWQAVVMSKKHRIVLESMMPRSKLIHIFKCAGRFCSFSTDSTEDALLHASTHQRVGGEGALDCAYCDFDTTSNTIDLVMHVFKKHSSCQYVCGLCFYRAAASQLVNAHFIRAHPEAPMVSVLRTNAGPKPCSEDEAKDLLSRKDAVQFYSCAHLNPDNSTCKFRSYISNKFSEHLQQRHPDLPHGCAMCSYSSVDPDELVQHMKTHNIMLYQCTWCVHGAEQESELLAHCSAKHPDRQPQAYLRIITSKDAGLRMLPLAQLNISKVPTEELSPTVNHENPVREAERSIELEKLITHTMLMIESSTPAHHETEPERVGSTGPQNMLTPATQASAPNLRMLLTQSSYPAFDTQSRPVTPVQEQPTTEAITPVLKMEPQEPTPEKAPNNSDIIYSLDSDDEGVGIIDLSQEVVPPAQPNKAAPPVETPAPNTVQAVDTPQPITDEMYKCERCSIFFADMKSLQDHIPPCYPYLKSVSKCPICSFKSDNQEMLLAHIKTCMSTKFTKTSTESIKRAKRYICGVCRCVGMALVEVKAHLKRQHSINKIRIQSEVVDTIGVFTVFEHINKPKPKGKRKLSATTVSKQKGYGPLEIDQLPINPILDELVFCTLCGFNTKVRLNMVRHLQRHAEQQPVAKTVPVNPVPHLETNEKHFDKMLNLASSSLVNRPDKSSKDAAPLVAQHVTPEAASRYPKYVPERQRHTCGAAGCSYISLDEDMLKCHWETLHANSTDYRCVHCPSYQQLDRSRPLTAARIIAHLKMHDVNLYACSLCAYYHHKRNILEKHLLDVHKGGRALVVRGEGAVPTPGPSATVAAAPTMDLKPWQCGLCQFKSRIRPEVVEHCAKTHQSKMQYKCSYCPFRTSAVENVTKHQATSHAEKQPEIFYYYYKEGDLPDEPDGTPRWAKQQQKAPKQTTEVKTEIGDGTTASTQPETAGPLSAKVAPISVDLNMVKIEVDTDSSPLTSTEDLCKKYGLFCGPNGLKFKCPLCKVVSEDKEEVMQSHLYEELRYRKWGCRICSYKGFHKKGLDEHMTGEHGANAEPLELPLDVNVESWVDQLLKYQSDLIVKSRDNLAKQKIQFESSKAQPSTSRAPAREQIAPDNTTKQSMKELEETFGQFGAPKHDCYCCPKCDFETREESAIRDHLETELTKIRWSCSRCSEKFQNYHEAQFHCKSVHLGQPSHPSEVVRSPALRAAWVAAVIRIQRNSISSATGKTGVAGSEDGSVPDRPARAHSPDDSENSLLVVRFEQKVPTLEGAAPARKRPAPVANAADSDEERLVIDEPLEAPPQTSAKKPRAGDKCPYCPMITRTHQRLSHILKHYNLQSLSCPYCNHTNSRKKALVTHIITVHPNRPVVVHKTAIPEVPPSQYLNIGTLTKTCPVDAMIRLCLTCLTPFTEAETASHAHAHAHQPPRYGSIGNLVVKCGNCASAIFEDVNSLHEHHNQVHKYLPMNNYTFFRIYATKDVTSPREATWSVKVSRLEKRISASGDDRKNASSPVQERKIDDCTIMPSPKRVARKSTAKLPYTAVAKKSTTKLPLYVYSDSELDSEDEEYSYYGTRPTPLHELDNVTTLMPFYNRLMRFSVTKLNEIININPQVSVENAIKK